MTGHHTDTPASTILIGIPAISTTHTHGGLPTTHTTPDTAIWTIHIADTTTTHTTADTMTTHTTAGIMTQSPPLSSTRPKRLRLSIAHTPEPELILPTSEAHEFLISDERAEIEIASSRTLSNI